MQKSIFKKYFLICASLIFVSITILGIVLMLFSSQYVRTEKYNLLTTNVNKAVDLIEDLPKTEEKINQADSKTKSFFTILAQAIEADFFLVDTDGNTLYCTEQSPCVHTDMSIPSDVVSDLNKDGLYREMGTLNAAYKVQHYTVASTVKSTSGKPIGYVFASMETSKSLTSFLQQILKMFIISSVGVFLVVMVIIYFVTHQMVKPLREMSVAAQEFGKGDFTKRLTVYNYDEVGQLAMALNNMAQSLSTLETMRRSFIANVSHELKTPMTTIGGFIDGILDGTIPPQKQKQYLRIVSDEVKRLSRVVRSMLNLAQIEAGETEIKLEKFDVVDTICQTLFNLEHQINDKHINIAGLDHEKVYVEADQDLIHQVVYNLTENAIKFTNDGGTIEFEFSKESGRTLVGVKNTGEGLSREEIPHVFDRFYKTDRSRGIDKNGVGLGLYIVRSIINLHGGEIIIKSVQGEYCEFLFTLQTAKSQAKLRKPRDSSSS